MVRSASEALEAGVQPGAVVRAVVADGPVAGWLVVEETAAAGVERRCAVVGLENYSVVSAGLLSEVKLAGDAVPIEDVMPAWAPALAGAFWAAQRARADAQAVRSQLREHEARLERIVDAAHEYANDNDLCSRFDDFMVENGLRPRARDWDCVVDATVRIRIPVSSHSSDSAASAVTDEMVVDAISALRGRLLADAVQEHDVVDVEEG